MQIDLEE